MSGKMIEKSTIDILFFERPIADLEKFTFKIAKRIRLSNIDLKLGVVCMEIPQDKNGIDEYYHWNNIKNNIDKFLITNEIKLIVFSNYRIPDIEFILHAKHLGIKTILIQEGLIYEGISINDVSVKNVMISFFSYFKKSISYINTIFRMCNYERKAKLKISLEILRKRKNITITLANCYSEPLRTDFVLTMGEYWDKYYTDTVGYSLDQIRLVGDHDLDDFEVGDFNENAICYIATVLVEDGMVKRKDFEQFVKALSVSISDEVKMYVKLHPRSDKSLYKILQRKNVEFVEKSGYLPSVNLYIGHRGSLIGKALYESDNLILWQFSNEEYCFYEKFASAIVNDQQSLKNAISVIDITKKTNNKRDEIKKYYKKNPDGAIYTITNLILAYYQNKNI